YYRDTPQSRSGCLPVSPVSPAPPGCNRCAALCCNQIAATHPNRSACFQTAAWSDHTRSHPPAGSTNRGRAKITLSQSHLCGRKADPVSDTTDEGQYLE